MVGTVIADLLRKDHFFDLDVQPLVLILHDIVSERVYTRKEFNVLCFDQLIL